MTYCKLLAVALILLFLTSCASGPKYAEVPPLQTTDRAIVVVYRVYSTVGAAWSHGVFVDGTHVADLKNDGFTRFTVTPGKHLVSVGTKSKPTRSADEVDMIAGKTYYFGEHPSMMAYVPNSFGMIDDGKVAKWLKGKHFQPPFVQDVN
jgi:hypothetical protein